MSPPVAAMILHQHGLQAFVITQHTANGLDVGGDAPDGAGQDDVGQLGDVNPLSEHKAIAKHLNLAATHPLKDSGTLLWVRRIFFPVHVAVTTVDVSRLNAVLLKLVYEPLRLLDARGKQYGWPLIGVQPIVVVIDMPKNLRSPNCLTDLIDRELPRLNGLEISRVNLGTPEGDGRQVSRPATTLFRLSEV